MEENYYTRITRYTTGAFLRMKLGEALEQRKIAPHVFETERARRAPSLPSTTADSANEAQLVPLARDLA